MIFLLNNAVTSDVDSSYIRCNSENSVFLTPVTNLSVFSCHTVLCVEGSSS